MIPIKQKIQKTHRLSRGEFVKVSKQAWAEAGEVWHRQLLPKHFEVGAFREYRYKARNRKYEERKQRIMGHRRPMVWSGNLSASLLRQRDVTTTGNTNKRQGAVKIRLRGPRYLRGVHRGRGPNFREEIQAISNRDGRILARVMDKRITSELEKPGRRVEFGHRR